MARTSSELTNTTKMLLLARPFSLHDGFRYMSKSTRARHGPINGGSNEEAGMKEEREEKGWWMPHPRSGIYFPKGHVQEWMMDDIPSDAASPDCTYWFRNVDGVDYHKPDPNPI